MAAHISRSDYFNLAGHMKESDKNCAFTGFTQEAAASLGSGLDDSLNTRNLFRRKYFQVTDNDNTITSQMKAWSEHAR